MTAFSPPLVQPVLLAEEKKWTYEDWLKLPDDGTRYEVIDGELYMTPPPALAHESASVNLLFALKLYIQDQALGWVFSAPVGVRLPNQFVPVQPDIVFVSAAHKQILGKNYIEGVPDLVVEVLSPSNWLYDRKEKFALYQQAGVPEYWIVDYRAKTVEVFALDDGEYLLLGKFGLGETAASRVLAGFEMAVAEVFRDL